MIEIHVASGKKCERERERGGEAESEGNGGKRKNEGKEKIKRGGRRTIWLYGTS